MTIDEAIEYNKNLKMYMEISDEQQPCKFLEENHTALSMAIDTLRKYQQLKADYENRLKADMVAMLTDIQLEIEEKFNDIPFSYNHHQRTEFYRDIDEVIQQKINSLKEDNDV